MLAFLHAGYLLRWSMISLPATIPETNQSTKKAMAGNTSCLRTYSTNGPHSDVLSVGYAPCRAG